MTGKIPQGRDDLRQHSHEGALREGLGGLWRKKGVMDPHPSDLTWPESSFRLQEVSESLGCLVFEARHKPETMLEVVAALCWKGWVPLGDQA